MTASHCHKGKTVNYVMNFFKLFLKGTWWSPFLVKVQRRPLFTSLNIHIRSLCHNIALVANMHSTKEVFIGNGGLVSY